MRDFKEYCALMFPKGVLMKDPKGILVTLTKNVQAARQMRFTGVQQIADLESTIREYVLEAIEVEKSGRKVEYRKISDFAVPEELQNELDTNPALKTPF